MIGKYHKKYFIFLNFIIKSKKEQFTIFSLRTGSFPFGVKLDRPTRETIVAILKAERITCVSNAKCYSDVEEALRELKNNAKYYPGSITKRDG